MENRNLKKKTIFSQKNSKYFYVLYMGIYFFKYCLPKSRFYLPQSFLYSLSKTKNFRKTFL